MDNAMKLCPSITPGAFVVLLVTMAIPASVVPTYSLVATSPVPNSLPSSAQILKMSSFHSDATPSGVDCIGDGASCDGFTRESYGHVVVTNNADPRYHWRFKLTCDFGGDLIGPEMFPSVGPVSSDLTCNFGAQAKFWNVIVEYHP
jgi:hypothetical protein